MKVEDLMIGDWLLYKSDSLENAFPIQITREMFNKELVVWNDRFEPIPLTPEILEKNGFIQDTNYSFRFFSPKVYKTIDIGVDFTIKGFTFWYSDTISISCGEGSKINRLPCFVNELQHALKLCKIDKEIKL